MAILRNKTREQFTVVNSAILKDKTLSLKERGMLVTLLSLPDNWNFSFEGMCSLFPDGRDSVRAGLNSLEKRGFIRHYRERDEKGHLKKTVWEVYETPQMPVNTTDSEDVEEDIDESRMLDCPDTENPDMENPTLDNPTLDNPTLDNPMLDNPILGKPVLDKPRLGNPPQFNINDKLLLNKSNINNNLSLKKSNIKAINHSLREDKLYWSEMTEDVIDAYVSCFMDQIEYDKRASIEQKEDFALYELMAKSACEFISNPPKGIYVHVANKDRSYDEVRDTLMKLTPTHMDAVRNKINEVGLENIRYGQSYIVTMLYNIALIPATLLKPKKTENKSDYMKRTYDMDALLKAARVN